MSTPQIVSSLIAVAIAISIFWLVRKDHLISRDGLKWIFIALLTLVFGLFPSLNDAIGISLGISYPPIIIVLVGLGVVLIKLLLADIERAKMQTSITRLIQKVAILEAELSQKNK